MSVLCCALARRVRIDARSGGFVQHVALLQEESNRLERHCCLTVIIAGHVKASDLASHVEEWTAAMSSGSGVAIVIENPSHILLRISRQSRDLAPRSTFCVRCQCCVPTCAQRVAADGDARVSFAERCRGDCCGSRLLLQFAHGGVFGRRCLEVVRGAHTDRCGLHRARLRVTGECHGAGRPPLRRCSVRP